MSERWKSIKGYEGLYEVSDSGIVRSLDRLDSQGNRIKGRPLRPDVRPSGHLLVTLCRDGKPRRFWVHRLVLEAFSGERVVDQEACHNDGNPKNNVPSNLRWDTKSGNARDRRRHGTDAKARITHCPKGHEYTPENTYYSAIGWRHCRTCTLAGQRGRVRHPELQKG